MAKIAMLAPLLLAACATDDEEPLTVAPQVEYSALGQEPAWALRIDRDRIAYTGDDGRTRVSVTRPRVEVTAAGPRYATSRLVVDVALGACRDAVSGSGFPDAVTVSAGGRTVRGCGGPRLIERDQ